MDEKGENELRDSYRGEDVPCVHYGPDRSEVRRVLEFLDGKYIKILRRFIVRFPRREVATEGDGAGVLLGLTA